MSHKAPPPPRDSLWAMVPPSHRNAPATSREAAERIAPTTEEGRAKVLAELKRRGEFGGTDEELQAATGLSGNTERPRRGELVISQLVKDSGKKRATKSGSPAVVWVATERGRE